MRTMFATALCALLIGTSGCESGQTFHGDLSGVWVVTETIEDHCSSDDPEQQISYYVGEQNGDELTFSIYPSTDTFRGTIHGSEVAWSIEVPADSGTTSINFQGSVSDDGDEITGTAPWTWTDGVTSCNGTTTVVARRCSQPEVSFAGVWRGDWESATRSIDGTFVASVTQAEHFLSGTITVEEIAMYDATLAGVVCSDEVTFGDIEQVIVFAGQLIGERHDSAAGEYDYSDGYYGDHGSWTGSKHADASDLVSVAASYTVLGSWGGDLAFDGSHLWNLTTTALQQLDHEGHIVKAIATPGSYGRGLAGGSGSLFVGDEYWGTGLIYELDATDAVIFDAPDDGRLNGLCYDGTYLWGVDGTGTDCTLYRFELAGTVEESFACGVSSADGLACDADSIWIAVHSGSSSVVHELDHDGEHTASFVAEGLSVRGLATDGGDLWLSDWGGTLCKYSTSGSLLQTLSVPKTLRDVAFDGIDLWVAAGFLDETEILRVSTTDGSILSATPAFGNAPSGLTFADGELWSSDDVNGKVFLHTGASIFSSYPPFDVSFMTYDGDRLWCVDADNERIVAVEDGSVSHAIDWQGEALGGIAYHDGSIWVISNGASGMAAERLVQLSSSGEVVNSYAFGESTLPEAVGLAHDGTHLWFIGLEMTPLSTTLNRLQLPE